MKKTIYFFLAIVLGNILFLSFYFTLEPYKMIAFVALLTLVYSIPKFSFLLAQIFTERNFIESGKNATDSIVIKKQNRKSALITVVALILLSGFHVYGYWNYFNYANEDLTNKGIYTPAIVTDKKLETRSKHLSGVYIYYCYKYNGVIYKHNCLNDSFKKGDTIVVKFSPTNPDHHIIIDKEF